MEYLIRLLIAGIIFGFYYLIGKIISKKIFYGSKFKYLFGTAFLFIISLIIISIVSGFSFEEIFRRKEAYLCYAAIVFGSYYGLKNADIVNESKIPKNSNK